MTSNIVDCLKKAQLQNLLGNTFTPAEAKKALGKINGCKDHIGSISTFLPKHRKGNDRGYKEYFKRVSKKPPKYEII